MNGRSRKYSAPALTIPHLSLKVTGKCVLQAPSGRADGKNREHVHRALCALYPRHIYRETEEKRKITFSLLCHGWQKKRFVFKERMQCFGGRIIFLNMVPGASGRRPSLHKHSLSHTFYARGNFSTKTEITNACLFCSCWFCS